MKSLRANLVTVDPAERRGAPRWLVELPVALRPGEGQAVATVRNLSETGMLLETEADVQPGELLDVEVPGPSRVRAKVIWRKGRECGCEFDTSISTGVVSAAILQAPLDAPTAGDGVPRFEEFPVGVYPSVDELAEWRAQFDRTHGVSGYRLVAYRQTRGGLMIAIASVDRTV